MFPKIESPVMIQLPPGFRFHPTDEELITHYLLNKVIDTSFQAVAIGEVDLNSCEPWDLPKKAKIGEEEWYFFIEKDRKYATGMRCNRATESGYWKATGKDKEIHKLGKKHIVIGMKKTLVFYKGRAPRGERTNWVMHEYRLHGNFSNHNFSTTAREKWVVGRIFHKKIKNETSPYEEGVARSKVDDCFLESPTLMLSPLTDRPSEVDQDQEINSFFADEINHNQHSINNLSLSPFFYRQPDPLFPSPSSDHGLYNYTNITEDGTCDQMMNTQITSSKGSDGDECSNKADDQVFEGLPFSSSISDLWSY